MSLLVEQVNIFIGMGLVSTLVHHLSLQKFKAQRPQEDSVGMDARRRNIYTGMARVRRNVTSLWFQKSKMEESSVGIGALKLSIHIGMALVRAPVPPL